jgi:hypothetical protein
MEVIMTNASVNLSSLQITLKTNYWDLLRMVDALTSRANDLEKDDRVHSAKELRQIAHDILLSLSEDMPDASWRMDDLVKKLGNE